MSRLVTLSQIMEQSRLRADKKGSGFIQNDELISYINNSYAELYDLLVGAYGNDYYSKEYQFSTNGNSNEYALPKDFYKLLGVDYIISPNGVLTLKPYQLNERNRYQNGTYWSALVGVYGPRYRITSNNIHFAPNPDGAYNIKLIYVPVCPTLKLETDRLDGVNGWEEYIIIDAAIKMLQKEESDITVLAAQKGAITARINLMAENRDAGQSFRVTDVTSSWLDVDGDVYRG